MLQKEKQKLAPITPTKTKASVKQEIKSETTSPVKGGRKKKEEEVQEVWKWLVKCSFKFFFHEESTKFCMRIN